MGQVKLVQNEEAVAVTDTAVASDPKMNRDLAVLTKAMGHPIRVQIVRMLIHQTSCMCTEIVDSLPLAQSTVSQHLRVLKDAGLVKDTTDGSAVRYGINWEQFRRLRMLISSL